VINESSRLITAKQAQDLDLKSREKFGISTLVLMENAGRAVAEEAAEIIKKNNCPGKVAIFCGRGNNGGDGFVAARHLLTFDIRPDIFLAGEVCDVKNEARINLEILLKLKQKITEVNAENLYLVKNKISKCALIIDALLGVGLKGEVRGILRDLIAIINASKKYILSVDIPSGLNATGGRVLGFCVKADRTVTFVAKKRGMVLGEGPKYCGKVVVKGLGLPL
jgi:NAD(P)H-hydrate epimerase